MKNLNNINKDSDNTGKELRISDVSVSYSITYKYFFVTH